MIHAFIIWLVTFFGPEVWTGLGAILSAAVIDALLTMVLALQGKRMDAFSLRRTPQFLLTNVAPFAAALLIGGVWTHYDRQFVPEYLGLAAVIAGWLGRDWRTKWVMIWSRMPGVQPD